MTRSWWLVGVTLLACDPTTRVGAVADALSHRADADVRGTEAHWRRLLAEYLVRAETQCLPPVEQVLSPPAGSFAPRRITGELPHYDVFDGPLRYRVGAGDGHWRVELNVLVEATPGGMLELPDCALAGELHGPVRCEGLPYEEAPGLDACPGSGRFEAEASRTNIAAMLRRWSTEVEAYWNRDAERYDLPVRYDFTFFLPETAVAPVDLRLPLWHSCGRTPYFVALRSGWSIPLLAHEVGHYLGLLDEYEPLSGISALYPKTPYAGSENSRMGISMKPHTRLFPIHHYLVLRAFHCDRGGDPFEGILAR